MRAQGHGPRLFQRQPQALLWPRAAGGWWVGGCSPETFNMAVCLTLLHQHRAHLRTHAPTHPPTCPPHTQVTAELCNNIAARVRGGEPVIDVDEAAMRITLDVFGLAAFDHDFGARGFGPCELFEVSGGGLFWKLRPPLTRARTHAAPLEKKTRSRSPMPHPACPEPQAVPPLLEEFTLRSTNPLRKLVMTLAPWMPEARAYNAHVRTVHGGWGGVVGSVRVCGGGSWWARHPKLQQACLPLIGRRCWPPHLPSHPPTHPLTHPPACWRTLVRKVREVDVAAAEAAGDNSLRVCLARLTDPHTGALASDAFLMPHCGVYLTAG